MSTSLPCSKQLNVENNHLCPLVPCVSKVTVIPLLRWLARRSLEDSQAGGLKAHWGSVCVGVPTGDDFQESAAPSSCHFPFPCKLRHTHAELDAQGS